MLLIFPTTVVVRRLFSHTRLPPGIGYHLKKPRLTSRTRPPHDAMREVDLRNVALLAHIDAGKTTTTECMLHLAGRIDRMGSVDDGTTVTDHLVQERQRGISITASAISFSWFDEWINLIDTPGHLDFMLEVERSLRVVDGALVILDSSAGVEAQTISVWRQAVKFHLPALVYVNKMDKINSNIELCLKSIRDKMKAIPVLLNYPLLSDKGRFEGLIDPINGYVVRWLTKDNIEVREEGVPKFGDIIREDVIGQLSEWDPEIAAHILSSEEFIPPGIIQKSIRKAVGQRKVVPVMFGSSLRSQGVHAVLDAICKYLPNPTERSDSIAHLYGDRLCCLAFKTCHHPYLGCLTFVRLYTGHLSTGSKVFNLNRHCMETVGKIYQPFGSVMNLINTARAGEIVVLSGLKVTVTGDTITEKDMYDRMTNDKKVFLAGIQPPSAVYRCIIEPVSVRSQNKLDTALMELTRDDPSLKVHTDEDSQETILEGMGKLHIEIIKDRLLSEYGLQVFLGPLQINYRETITRTVSMEQKLEQAVDGRMKNVTVKLTLIPSPGHGALTDLKLVHVQGEKSLSDRFSEHILTAIRDGCVNASMHGPLLCSRVQDVQVQLDDLQIDRGTPVATLSACSNKCFLEAMKTGDPVLLEPYVEMMISVPEEYGHAVLSDLTVRGSRITAIDVMEDRWKCMHAIMPLSNMDHYATCLRTISSGTANFHLSSVHYEQLDKERTKRVLNRHTNPGNSQT